LQRAWAFLKEKLARGEKDEEPTLNDTFDRAEDRGWSRPEPGDQDARLLKLEERAASIERSLRNIDDRLGRVEVQADEFRLKADTENSFASRNQRSTPPQPRRSSHRTPNEDLVAGPPNLPSLFELKDAPRQSRLAASSSRQRGNQGTVESFERALCVALGEQSSTGLEIDALLTDIQAQLGGVQVEVVPVGSQRQIMVLWLPPSRDGFAVVSPGGLVDSDVMKFFDVAFGRRIFGCRQPARIVRDGNEIVVERKGTLESS
jgi:hypothetical protein